MTTPTRDPDDDDQAEQEPSSDQPEQPAGDKDAQGGIVRHDREGQDATPPTEGTEEPNPQGANR